MKENTIKPKQRTRVVYIATLVTTMVLVACSKNNSPHNGQASQYSSEVLDKWISMQIRLMKNATGIPNQAFSRHFAYAGITAIESIGPGVSQHAKKYRKWNGLTGLPVSSHFNNFYYPANVNAAMASINRLLFPNASVADKAAIDSLEHVLRQGFLALKPSNVINSSEAFGKAVANAVYNWAETDGYKNAGNSYTPPTGPGLWKPTPPAMSAASLPYTGLNRTVIAGSINNTMPGAPYAYSTDASSAFYQMVKQVYDVSQTLTPEQTSMATFWRDVPGATSPGHWLSIVQQVVKQTNSRLDKAAIAYALTGSAVNDALITCWKAKFHYSLVRPITYIREVMGFNTWNSYLGNPPHPEYPSAHSSLSAAAADVLERLFGNIGTFTDHTYDYLGLAPRTYSTLTAIGAEAGQSRLYAGIHYQASIDSGLAQGRKVSKNIFSNPSGNH